MARPGRNLHIRLTNEDACQNFDRLATEFRGLPAGTVLRLLIEGQLLKGLEENVEVVTSQIRQPGAAKARKRTTGLNTRNRIGEP